MPSFDYNIPLPSKKCIVAFGEIVCDVFPDSSRIGGAPLNFAYFCKKLGAESHIISAVGNDAYGSEILGILKEENISASSVKILPQFPTGKVLVQMLGEGLHRFEICSPAAWDHIDAEESLFSLAKRADAFEFGTLAQRSEISRKTLWQLLNMLSPDCLKIFDVNLRGNFFTNDIIAESMSRADILKTNEDEFPIISDTLGISAKTPDNGAFEIMKKCSLKYLLLTRGEKGYKIFTKNGKIISGESDDIEVVDTVGAGDSFTAAFTMGILNGESPENAAKSAGRLSQEVCTRRGALCL